jgi:hypothetical protein
MPTCTLLRTILLAAGLCCSTVACQTNSAPANPTEIRTQADADAYNALVTNEADRLICRRERLMGSIRTRLVCMTGPQWSAVEEELTDIRGRGSVLGN